ncbi:retrovirus-related pol polyprotein from transposon TNT 1-94 [Tanacetum coccineum]
MKSSNKVTLDQLLSDQIPGNIVEALGGRGKRKEKISSKEVIFTKADESSSMPILEITFDSEFECETLEPLSKLIRAAPAGTSNSLISLVDLTLNMANLTLNTSVPKKTKPTSDKVSPTYVIKKRIETKSPDVHVSQPEKKADLSTEQLILTLMDEVESLKEQIKVPSENTRSCPTCGSTDHLTKEHLEQTAINNTLTNLKALLFVNPTAKKAPMIPKPFKECKYYGFNDHHYDNCEYYHGCEVCGSVAHETADCPKKHPNSRKPRIANKRSTEPTEKYSKESGPKVVFGDNSLGDTKGYGSVICNGITFTRVANVNGLKHNLISISLLCDANLKIEILNETRVKELRSDNGTEFRNHKLEEFCDEKGISQNFVSLCTPEQNGGEAVNTACYTQNISIIMKRHRKIAYDVFRGRSLDISYFYVFGYLVHIHNHKDHLGKFNEKADDGFFLGYSQVEKAFMVFNIIRQEMEETYHITFSEDDEAISQSNTEGDAINFNENRSFPDDEILGPRDKVTQCSGNFEHFPYVPAYETNLENNITLTNSPTPQDSVSPEEPLEFTSDDDHLAPNDQDYLESADNIEPAKIQDIIISEPISNVQPSLTLLPSAEGILHSLVPQERWSRENHIELVNIIGEPLTGITTRSRIRDSEAASALKCMYVNFLSEMKPKKLIEALEGEGWIITMQEELNQF